MTQSSSPGIGFAFGLQSAKGSHLSNASNFRKMRVLSAQLGPNQGMEQLPQEVGGGYHTGASYKQFVAGTGQVRMLTRLDASMGQLLKAAIGSPSASGTSGTGFYRTTFRPVDNYCNHPWLTARSFIPNCTPADAIGQEIKDAKLAQLGITLQAGSPGLTELALLGLDSGFVAAATASTWDTAMQAYEGTDSVVMSSVSGGGAILESMTGLNLGAGTASDFAVPTVSLQFAIQNKFSDGGIRDELVIGSLQMDDLALISQTMSFQLVYKWRNPALYQAIYALTKSGSNYGVSTTPTPLVLQDTITIKLLSPRMLGAEQERLEIELHNVSLETQGVTLQSGQFITMPVSGTASIGASPSAYATFTWYSEDPFTEGVTYA